MKYKVECKRQKSFLEDDFAYITIKLVNQKGKSIWGTGIPNQKEMPTELEQLGYVLKDLMDELEYHVKDMKLISKILKDLVE